MIAFLLGVVVTLVLVGLAAKKQQAKFDAVVSKLRT
jgi:hypothetical protein